jgi:hypothetical protein
MSLKCVRLGIKASGALEVLEVGSPFLKQNLLFVRKKVLGTAIPFSAG